MFRFLIRVHIVLVICLVLALTFTVASNVRPSHASSGISGLSVSVGYAEDKHQSSLNPGAFPVPWSGSPNTIFLGNPVYGSSQCGTLPHCFDAGAIRLDNSGLSDVTVHNVSVDDHSSLPGGAIFSLWGSFTVPAGKSVILTENPPNNNPSYDNFDTSGFPMGNCTPLTVAPTVTIAMGGPPTTLVDSTHVLDTSGIDTESCSTQHNESIQWRHIGTVGVKTGTLTLSPDNTGQASFTYTDTAPGTDIVIASVTTAYTVGPFLSNQTSILWTNDTTQIWSGADIGNPLLAGSDSLSNGIWTVAGSGTDIGGYVDQFHFVWQPLVSDGGISAQVLTQTNTNSHARAGVMLRQSTDPSAPFYAVVVTPQSGIYVLKRSTQGGGVSTVVNLLAVTVPVYLQVQRSGTTYTASTSSDGVTWTPITGSSVTLGPTGTWLAGLAVTSHTTSKVSTATFGAVSTP